jgi:hypothetical protein
MGTAHVMEFVPETSEQAVIHETKLVRQRWKRYMTFMIIPHVDLYDYVWQPPALDQIPPESNDPRGEFVLSRFPYYNCFEFDWRALDPTSNFIDTWLSFFAEVNSAVEHYEI